MSMEYRYAEPTVVATVGGMVAPYERWQTLSSVPGRRAVGNRRRVREKVARAYVSHQPEKILGRSDGRGLRLVDSDEGLRFEIDLPDTQDGRDLLELVQRGLIGSSIGFWRPGSAVATGVNDEDDSVWTVLQDVDLREISLTPNPAYDGTEVGVIERDAVPTPPSPRRAPYRWASLGI